MSLGRTARRLVEPELSEVYADVPPGWIPPNPESARVGLVGSWWPGDAATPALTSPPVGVSPVEAVHLSWSLESSVTVLVLQLAVQGHVVLRRNLERGTVFPVLVEPVRPLDWLPAAEREALAHVVVGSSLRRDFVGALTEGADRSRAVSSALDDRFGRPRDPRAVRGATASALRVRVEGYRWHVPRAEPVHVPRDDLPGAFLDLLPWYVAFGADPEWRRAFRAELKRHGMPRVERPDLWWPRLAFLGDFARRTDSTRSLVGAVDEAVAALTRRGSGS